MDTVELLAPAGDFQTALAAFEAGADAVYCGLADFSARAFATNFSFEDLENLLAYARGGRAAEACSVVRDRNVVASPLEAVGDFMTRDRNVASPLRCDVNGDATFLSRGKKVYVTFNTLLDEDQFDGAIETLARLEDIGPDGVIVQDLGVAKLIHDHFPSLSLHASTQLVAHNLEGVLALGELGFTRVVLARELSLEEIASIAKRCGDIELEVFIHGALCYSLSGLCLFGAMEKGRSGNRGKCPYCCRMGYESEEIEVERRGGGGQSKGSLFYPFSMKDLRLGDDVKKLVEAGVTSLKIEGRMKSPLYVASVTKYYRDILDGATRRVTLADLETVFSRRTTELYFNGRTANNQQPATNNQTPIDSESLGHLGTEVGVVKKVTRDREGRAWLRFHTCRGLEKHDGLQFDVMTDEGRHLGMGIVEMRQAISRRPVFEVNAGVDVEVLVNEDVERALKPGVKIYCSMSNAVKRMFPTPSFRPSDYEGGREVDVEVEIKEDCVSVLTRQECRVPPAMQRQRGCDILVACKNEVDEQRGRDIPVACHKNVHLTPAKDPSKTPEGVRKAFSKLGGTDYRLGELTVNDPDGLFVPMSVLNDLRRDLVEALNENRDKILQEKIEAAKEEEVDFFSRDRNVASPLRLVGDFMTRDRNVASPLRCDAKGDATFLSRGKTGSTNKGDATFLSRNVKIRIGQAVPSGDWNEVIVAINADTAVETLSTFNLQPSTCRLATPVYTSELAFNKLRSAVKRFLRAGYDKWEASDLATLRMLKQVGITDITADWTLYAFNARALAQVASLGVKRFVASPENGRENLQYLAESGYDVEFLTQQSTPLFISLTKPEGKTESGELGSGLSVFVRDGLWVTTKSVPRTFATPSDVSTRLDLSWDLE